MRKPSAAAAVVWVLAACGGGVSPTAPAPDAVVGGEWSGSAAVRDAAGGGCLGYAFRAEQGEALPISLDLRQAGQDFSGSLVWEELPNACGIHGTVDARTITFSYGECEATSFRGVPCIGGKAARDMVLFGATFAGHTESSNSDRVVGTLEVLWATFKHFPEANEAVRVPALGPDGSLDLLVVYDLELDRRQPTGR